MQTETGKAVRELVLENPAAARIFERFRIDYCCGGHKSLSEACNAANVRLDEVVAALEKPGALPGERDWQTASLSELAQHIVDTHHAFTREELKRLEPLMTKVLEAHGKNHPELARVRSLFRELAQELTMHMMKEEQILFPYIIAMEEAVTSRRPLPPAMFGTIQNPVHMMTVEHDSAGQVLEEMRHVTGGYALPSDACLSYQTLFQALQAFETDLHYHIHLENNILFPRALKMEEEAF